MENESSILGAARDWVAVFYKENIPKVFVYHNFQHVCGVVEAIHEITAGYELPGQTLQNLELAAWFHDAGYDQGPEGHEERGKAYARTFMEEHQLSENDIQEVEKLIMATCPEHEPQSLEEEIIRDADLSHLGKEYYWDRCSRVRQELLLTRNNFMPEAEWARFELSFMESHQFYTDHATELYSPLKKKNVKRLRKYYKRVSQGDVPTGLRNDKKKKKKSSGSEIELKELNLGRGVETMFRATYRTHVNLSSIADNKANIMLSINAIIISIVVSNLVPKFGDNPRLIIPTFILLAVCLTTLVFAILSTRPKVTEGRFTREDIQEKRSNLLFFGNFYKMDIDDFHWGMTEMIKDSDFLYSSMTRDLYFLGVVLAKKYRFLRICYGVFMYGLIGSVLAFAIAYTM